MLLPQIYIERYQTPKGLVINYGDGRATKWENRESETFCAPPQVKVKLVVTPLFKEWKLFTPPTAHTSIWFKLRSYCIKTTPKHVMPPFSMAKTFLAPPPHLFIG